MEIERKFLVESTISELCREATRSEKYFTAVPMEQGYLGNTGDWTVRVRKESAIGLSLNIEGNRITPKDNWKDFSKNILTLKQRITDVSCIEIEEPVSDSFYNKILAQCEFRPIEKIRFQFFNYPRFEVDLFINPEFDGLILAEIELASESEFFDRPAWLGEEVTHDIQYKNFLMNRRLVK
jgi:adenylate cyclase